MGSDLDAMSSGRRLTTAFRKERQCSERQKWGALLLDRFRSVGPLSAQKITQQAWTVPANLVTTALHYSKRKALNPGAWCVDGKLSVPE